MSKGFLSLVEELKDNLSQDNNTKNRFVVKDTIGGNWVWIGDNLGIIGDSAAHYELSHSRTDHRYYIALHFEGKVSSQKRFLPILKSLPPVLEPLEWRKIDSIKYKYSISETENIIEKIKEYLTEMDNLIGDSVREIIDDNFRKNKTMENEINAKTDIKKNLNQILFGPPGTGKTYNAIPHALAIIESDFKLKDTYSITEWEELKMKFDSYRKNGQIEFITFHQSMCYEDFVEGIKPIGPNTNENPFDSLTYKIQDGVFKSICIEASKTKNLISNAPIDKNENIELDDSILRSYYEKFASTLPDQEEENSPIFLESKVDKTKFWLFKNSAKSIVVKAGTMKTNMPISYNELSMVAFNRKEPAYKSYTPVIIEKLLEQAGFKENIINNTSKNFVLVIDEINRGNVSAIFGELITLLEPAKRVGGAEHLKIKLPYSKTDFEVPANLYIIGTMNTADRSIEALDTALRRRFSFVEMPPLLDLIAEKTDDGIELRKILTTINSRIEILLDKDHLIGHSYFINVKSAVDLQNVFHNNIIPLLQEYFYGDYGKIGLVLGEDFFVKPEKSDKTSFAKFHDYDASGLEERQIFTLKNVEKMSTEKFIEAINILLS